MTVLQKLLKYPHAAVFDTRPHDAVVFRLRHSDQCLWSVADEVMTVSNGSSSFTYQLQNLTVGQLASALTGDGFEVSNISSEFLSLSATVLVEGSGDQLSNDKPTGFTSLLYALFGGYAREIREARYQGGEAIKQMVIPNSEGEWLDLWGNLYNHKRKQNQSDASYAPEIPREAFRIRVNALAIEQAIFDATGKHVIIEEPWGSMFRLDDSQLSGAHKFYNGETVGYHLIRPLSLNPIDFSDVIPVITRNKAAGVIILPAEVRPSSFVDATVDGTVWMGIQNQYATLIRSADEGGLSDSLVLSGAGYTRNYLAAISSFSTHVNSRRIGWADGGWDDRPWLSFVFEDSCPVSAVMQTYQINGYTWIDAGVWGGFTWEGEATDAVSLIIGGETEMVVTSFGIDSLEIRQDE